MRTFPNGRYYMGSNALFTTVYLGALLALLFVGQLFPYLVKYLAVVGTSYGIVDTTMWLWARYYQRFTTLWQRFIPILLGIIGSAVFADWYVSMLVPVLDEYSPFLQNLTSAMIVVMVAMIATRLELNEYFAR